MTDAITSFPTHSGLATLFGVALLGIVSSMLCLYIILVQIELQRTLSFAMNADVELEENTTGGGGGGSMTDQTEGKNDNNNKDESPTTNGDSSSIRSTSRNDTPSKPTTDMIKSHHHKSLGGTTDIHEGDETVMRRLYLPMHRRGTLAAVVILLTFMSYLLLVRSNANVVLSWLGMLLILLLLLRQSIAEELRRQRLDRLSSILSLILIMALSLNLATYANQQHAQGDIYEGSARIIGYDLGSYNQTEEDTTIRTDLDVSWGGQWGCPNIPDQYCIANVSGALCETTVNTTQDDAADAADNDNNDNRRRARRTLQLQPSFFKQQQPRRRRIVGAPRHRINQEEEDTMGSQMLVDEEIPDELVDEEFQGEQNYVQGQIKAGQDAYQQNQQQQLRNEPDTTTINDQDSQDEESEMEKNQLLKDKNDELKKDNEDLKAKNEELQQQVCCVNKKEIGSVRFWCFYMKQTRGTMLGPKGWRLITGYVTRRETMMEHVTACAIHRSSYRHSFSSFAVTRVLRMHLQLFPFISICLCCYI